MWPQTASGGCFASIASRIAVLPRCSPGRRAVAVALRRRVDDQHGAVGAGGEPLGGLLLGQVEAPVPGRRRDAGAEAEEGRCRRSRPTRRAGRSPRPSRRRRRRRAARPRSRCCRGRGSSASRSPPAPRSSRLEPLVNRGEVAGADRRRRRRALRRRGRPPSSRSRWRSLKARILTPRRPRRRLDLELADPQAADLELLDLQPLDRSPGRSSAGRSRARRSRRRRPPARRPRPVPRRSGRGSPVRGPSPARTSNPIVFDAGKPLAHPLDQLCSRHRPLLSRSA